MNAPAHRADDLLIRAEGLKVQRAKTEVLHGVSLDIRAGEIVAVLGPNGAGKSTLLDALGRIVEPSGGTLTHHGRVATVMQAPGLARRSVRANVDLAQTWWGVPRRDRKARTAAALEAMHADHLAKRPAVALSGGERRRVHLARAVALQPDVLLLDEPFAGLDAETQAALRDDTASALRTSAGAVVLVVHDRAEAWALADRLIVLFNGEIAAQGRPQDLLERPPDAAVAKFLGYDGELRIEGDRVLTRPAHVRLDPAGPISGQVRRVTPIEDGGRVEIETPAGRVNALAVFPLPAVGDDVRIALVGGVRFES